MCDLKKKHFKPAQTKPSRRLKIWEVGRSYHCAILGTCLTLPELHKLIRQSGVILGPKASDYEAHRALVSVMGQDNRSARVLTRLLDKKYLRTLNQLAKLSDSTSLSEAWDQAMRSGDIAGPFWGLVTHPHVSDALLDKVYGEVHMLSHLEGASNRADIKRLAHLESTVAALKTDAIKQTHHQREQLGQKQRIIHQLEHQLLLRMSQPIQQQPPIEVGLSEELSDITTNQH